MIRNAVKYIPKEHLKGEINLQTDQMKNDLIRILYYAVIAAVLWFVLKYVLPLLLPFIIGFCIALILRRPADRLSEAWHGHRTAACVLLLILFHALAILLLILLGSGVLNGTVEFSKKIPAIYTETLGPSLDRIQQIINDLLRQFSGGVFVEEMSRADLAGLVGKWLSGTSSAVLSSLTGLAGKLPSLLINVILTIVSSFFLTIDYYRFTARISGALPARFRSLLDRIGRNSGHTVHGFLRAYAILFCITTAELAIGLTILKIQGSLPLAFTIAVIDILPIVGAGLVLIPWGIAMLVLGKTFLGAGLLILYVIITVIRQSIEPRIVGHQIGLYPLVTLICMFVGARLFGFLGLFLLPVAATVVMQLRREKNKN